MGSPLPDGGGAGEWPGRGYSLSQNIRREGREYDARCSVFWNGFGNRKVAFFGEGFGEELGGDRKEGKAFLHGNYSS